MTSACSTYRCRQRCGESERIGSDGLGFHGSHVAAYLDLDHDTSFSLNSLQVAWIPHLRDTLFVCDTRSGARCPSTKLAALHLPADEDTLVATASFVNYRAVKPILTCNECDDPESTLSNAGFTYRFSGLSFVDVSAKVWCS